MNQFAISSPKIFTGTSWLTDHAVIIKGEIIEDVVPVQDVPAALNITRHKAMIVPAFIDIQIYGAHGSLFAVEPTVLALHKLYNYCTNGGASYFMPTVATNSQAVVFSCIDAINQYWNEDGKGVIGLHVEGPWINKEKRGAHIESFIHPPSMDEVKALLKKGKGVIKMITLAPEVCLPGVVEMIQDNGIIVSAGHSNATYAQATQAFNRGINAATHLYNAMSPMQHRAPGMVGAIFNHPKVMSSIVPDGFHVDFAAVAIAKKMLGNRLFIITDAVTETTGGLYPHHLNADKYEANGILSGSALTMAKAVKNCVENAGIPLDEALRMASLYPAQVMKLENQLCKIERGYTASFTLLEDDLQVVI